MDIQKLVFKRIPEDCNPLGQYALFTTDGKMLAGQTCCELISRYDSFSKLVVTFDVDHDEVKVAGSDD